MPFSIVRDDIANCEADAVVVSANEKLFIDGGAGYALASKVGLAKVQSACDAIGGCAPGKAVCIETGDVRNPLIIFTVRPIWEDGEHGEPAMLREALTCALGEAVSHGASTLALPLVSTGAFGFPPNLALQVTTEVASKIRGDDDYRPRKKTVLALAVALELDIEETSELLNCAGFSLSQSSRFDLIIEYFIRKSVYDCFTINEALFAFGEELLS